MSNCVIMRNFPIPCEAIWWNSSLHLFLFPIPPHKFLTSEVINMTNHQQFSLFPECSPFQAAVQAQLGVAHPVVHKHHIISTTISLTLIIYHQPKCHLPLHVLHADPRRTDLYCISKARRRSFSSAERDLSDSLVWPHPYDCILSPLSWRDLNFYQLLSWKPHYLSGFCSCVGHECSFFWLTALRVFHFALKLSISSQINHWFTQLWQNHAQ